MLRCYRTNDHQLLAQIGGERRHARPGRHGIRHGVPGRPPQDRLEQHRATRGCGVPAETRIDPEHELQHHLQLVVVRVDRAQPRGPAAVRGGRNQHGHAGVTAVAHERPARRFGDHDQQLRRGSELRTRPDPHLERQRHADAVQGVDGGQIGRAHV